MSDGDWQRTADTDEFDPWGADFQPTEDPPGARPNVWIVASIVLGLVVVGLVILLARDGDDSGGSAGPEATIGSSSSTTSSTVVGDGTISSVVITETVPPASCAGPGSQPTPASGPLQAFLNAALGQQGKPYEFDATAAADDPEPATFDTGELVEWASARAGVGLTDGSWLQYLALAECGAVTDVPTGLNTPGALVFGFTSEPTREQRPEGSFVAISLGDGDRIIDVQPSGGVGIYSSSTRTLTHAALIPDLGQGTAVYS